MKFRNEYWFLSNMYPIDFRVDGILYRSSENYFQAHKTSDPSMHDKIAAVSPMESKRLGRKAELRSDWDKIKIDVMKKALFYKFGSNNELYDKLVATGTVKLVEDNTWNDTFWGVCNGTGRNELGKLLMELRADLSTFLQKKTYEPTLAQREHIARALDESAEQFIQED